MLKSLLLFLFFSSSLFASFSEVEARVLYLIHKGEVEEGFGLYLKEAKEGHNYALLQKMGLTLLERGMGSRESDAQLLSIIGAGAAMHKLSLSILKEGLAAKDPKIQVASLHFLSRFEEDEATELLVEALSSPFLIIRLEAALVLAEKQYSQVVDHLLSFYGKIPLAAKILFPQILVHIDTPASTKFLKQLLTETDEILRIATLYFVAEEKREDLLPTIRNRATHPNVAEEEVAAFALGRFKDSESKPLLETLSLRKNKEVKLSALRSLYELGSKEGLQEIIKEAKEKNLFAITLLSDFEEEEAKETLCCLSKEEDPLVKLNAHFALLGSKNSETLPFFKELFLNEDLGFFKTNSPGKTLSYWKTTPSLQAKIEREPKLEEESLKFKAHVLTKSVEFPEEAFLAFISSHLLKWQKTPLISLMGDLLQNHNTPGVIHFLKEKQEMIGAPTIRAYATLALYQMTHEAEYEKKLLQFIQNEKGTELIVETPESLQESSSSPYLLSQKESSSFLINAFEVLAPTCKTEALDALIDAIAYGNTKNRYALAGLLVRMTE